MLIDKNAYLVTPALVSPTRNKGSQDQTPIFTIENQDFLVQMAQVAWPGPSSMARGQILEIWGPGNPEIWIQKMKKIRILKIQIRSAQNVGKVWISRKKILLGLFGAI